MIQVITMFLTYVYVWNIPSSNLGCSYILAIVVNAAVNTEVHMFGVEGLSVLFSLDKYPETELLDHVVAI